MRKHTPLGLFILSWIVATILVVVVSLELREYKTGDGTDYTGDAVSIASNVTADKVISGMATSLNLSDSMPEVDVIQEGTAADGRKLVRRAGITVETMEYDSYTYWLDGHVSKVGGYFESKDEKTKTDYEGNDYRILTATIRVPASELDDLLDGLAVNGNASNQWENQEDVTQSYTDISAHLDSLRVEQTRLNDLLSTAESIEEVITIEDRLSIIRYEIESYERQRRSYDNQIEYASVSLDLTEVVKYTESEPEGFLNRCGSSFSYSVGWLKTAAQHTLVTIVGSLPFMIIFAPIIFIILQVRFKWKVKKSQVTEDNDTKKDDE